MHYSSNTLANYIICFCNIFILYFVLHTENLLANNVKEDIDKKLVIKVIKLIENNQTNKIMKVLDNNNAKSLIDLTNWIKISSKNIKKKNIIKHYEKYKDWPDANNIIIYLEENINWEEYDKKYFNFFTKNKPKTRIGKIKYLHYLVNKKNLNQDKKIIENWKNGSFKKKDELYILKQYSYLFNKNINQERLDNLIWKKKWAEANRQLKRVDKKYQLLSKAKIKLARREYGVDYAIKKVPNEFKNNPSLIYERVKWRRIAKLTKESKTLLNNYLYQDFINLDHPELWWKEINWHARNLINLKLYDEAYKLLNKHEQNSAANKANAEWLLGWLSLEFINKPEQALKHFLNMKKIVKMPISISRANYWLGKTEEKLSNKEKSIEYYEISSIYNTTFYGLLSSDELKINKNLVLMNNDLVEVKLNKDFTQKINILRLLSKANEKKYSLRFINGLFKKTLNNKQIIEILNILHTEKRTDLYIRACKKAIKIDVYYQRCLFPLPYNIKINNQINASLIMAIAKQESEFFPKAISRSGALGLVQLMPNTAKNTAKKLGINYDKNKLLNDTQYNLLLGSKYLSSLISYYNGSIILAVASYNAGPTNVNKWIKMYGDPRNKDISYINWIELIPFNETRNYVQRVIENYIVYQQVLINRAIKNKKNIKELL